MTSTGPHDVHMKCSFDPVSAAHYVGATFASLALLGPFLTSE
jgi:hypothetical protein